MDELASIKAYARDLETSLKINKEMLQVVLEGGKQNSKVKQMAEQLE
jgi:hypothetical protein